MSFYFLDIKTLAFKKQFLYKYMERDPPPHSPPPLAQNKTIGRGVKQHSQSRANRCQPSWGGTESHRTLGFCVPRRHRVSVTTVL